MSTATPRPLAEMRACAEALCASLAPYCQRIEIAGSIRRNAPQCADIELLCVPIVADLMRPGDLFPRPTNLLDDAVRSPTFRYRLDKFGRPAVGDRYKRLEYGGIAVDLFSCRLPASWGVLMAIRTGPSEFSREMVTPRMFGGRLPDDCAVKRGTVWRGDERIELPEEQDFFALCGMDWIAPEDR